MNKMRTGGYSRVTVEDDDPDSDALGEHGQRLQVKKYRLILAIRTGDCTVMSQ